MAIEWMLLFVAGLCEICFAIALKMSYGLTKPWPSAITIIFIVASFSLLALAMKSIPVGTAYAVWTGIGVSGTVVLGMLFFDEPIHLLRVSSLMLIVIGLVGLQVIE